MHSQTKLSKIIILNERHIYIYSCCSSVIIHQRDRQKTDINVTPKLLIYAFGIALSAWILYCESTHLRMKNLQLQWLTEWICKHNNNVSLSFHYQKKTRIQYPYTEKK